MGAILARIGDADPERARRGIGAMAAATPTRGQLHQWLFPGIALGLQVFGQDASWSQGRQHLCVCHGFLTTPDGVTDQPQDANHADTLLRKYLRDGWRHLDGLDGQFTALVCRQGDDQVHVLRDIHGMRPLRVYRDADGVWLATEPRHIMAVAGEALSPDTESWVRHLLFDPVGQDARRTFFHGVTRLPAAAHTVIGPAGLPRELPYWAPERLAPLPRLGDSELLQRWQSATARAVRRAIPSVDFSVAVSGGVDSSSVALLAAEHLHEQGRAHDMHCFHIAYPGWGCDETGYARELEAALGSPVTQMDARQFDFARDLATYLRMSAVPLRRAAEHAEVWRQASARFKVACSLTGFGGDEYFVQPSAALAEPLRTGRLIAFFRDSLAFHRRYRRLPAAQRWRRWVQLALVPQGSRLRRSLTRLGLLHRWQPPAWLHPDWHGRARAWREQADKRVLALGYGRSWALAHYYSWSSGVTLDAFDAMFAAAGTEPRHPLFAREIAELALARSPTASRASVRPKPRLIATVPSLPKAITDRLDKTDFRSLAQHQLPMPMPSGGQIWQLERLGVLAAGGGAEARAGGLPEDVLVAEHWLRALLRAEQA